MFWPITVIFTNPIQLEVHYMSWLTGWISFITFSNKITQASLSVYLRETTLELVIFSLYLPFWILAPKNFFSSVLPDISNLNGYLYNSSSHILPGCIFCQLSFCPFSNISSKSSLKSSMYTAL